ncbi:conserved hypothetical protein [Trichinella spiralis]|uniref:hypothetical protein n=1 Tax=Trichinella spiralis TaxID=6334 RepID=UPI0001EFC409|nr:conserved hypothetical protein [Trichinella spiralis]
MLGWKERRKRSRGEEEKKFSSPSFAYWRLLLMSIKLFDLSNVCFFFYVQMYCAQFLYLFTDLNSPFSCKSCRYGDKAIVAIVTIMMKRGFERRMETVSKFITGYLRISVQSLKTYYLEIKLLIVSLRSFFSKPFVAKI